MDYSNKSFLERRPQRLCKMCGKCCRMATASIPYNELLRLSKEGDKSAIEFLDTFEPYETLQDALNADEQTVKNIPNWEKRTFYHCKHIKPDSNLCPKYEERFEVCRTFPTSPWAVTPPGCGFEGWLFLEREMHKKRIRKLKEEQILYKAKLKTNIPDSERVLYEKLIDQIDARVSLYSKYGAENW